MESNGTGSASLSVNGHTENYRFVIDSSGDQVHFIMESSGLADYFPFISGTAKRQ